MKISAFFKRPLNVFFLISAIGIVGFFVCACFVREGTLFDWMLIELHRPFTDYHRHIGFASNLSRAYRSGDACLPPLAYLLFHFLHAINPIRAGVRAWYHGYTLKYGLIIYIMWALTLAMTLLYLVRKLSRLSPERSLALTFLLLLSAPFFGGALETGSVSFLAVLLLCAALYLREQDEGWKRELALLLIACASGLKPASCVMGLLYVREGRWRDAGRLLLYGALLFLLPLPLTGGLTGLRRFLTVIAREFEAHTVSWTSLHGFVRYWTALLGYDGLGIALIAALFVVLLLVLALRTGEKWRALLYLTVIMASWHPKSQRSDIVFLILPLLTLIAETHDDASPSRIARGDACIDLALFAGVFSIPLWGIFGNADHWIAGAMYLLCLRSIAVDVRTLRAPGEESRAR